MTNLHARLAFFLATDALKELQRANWVHSTARFENVAEHSWHVPWTVRAYPAPHLA